VTTARARIGRRQLATIALVACVITPVFNLLTSQWSLHEVVQGLVDALIVSVTAGSYLLFIRDGSLRHWFRRLGFWKELALSSAIVLTLFLLGRALGQVVTTGRPWRFLASFRDAHLMFALPYFVLLAVTMQFLLQMNRLVGVNVLGYFAAGVYRRPTAEGRVFLFVDLVGSTQLAERLGSARYFELLQRFVDDLSDPVLEAEGEIYQYAGDEVVITWPMARGVHRANCVACFFAIRDAIARSAARYEREFGVVPRFRGGLDGGMVTAGELGDLRQQIVFVGDILNTAARLEEYAKRSDLDLVASGALLERLTLPPGVVATRCGELALRGKDAPVAAYGLASGETAALRAGTMTSPEA